MKEENLNYCIKKIKEILDYLRPGNKWAIAYGKAQSTWSKGTHVMYSGEEYFYIFEENRLLYTVNVTADSELTALSELMNKLAKKF